jgi:hypothetical protein
MSDLEDTLLCQIHAADLPEPVRKYIFHKPRRFHFDLAWLDRKVAAEVMGATFSGGRHVRGVGYESDCIKANIAALDGWLLLRFTRAMIEDGTAIETLVTVLKGENYGRNHDSL